MVELRQEMGIAGGGGGGVVEERVVVSHVHAERQRQCGQAIEGRDRQLLQGSNHLHLLYSNLPHPVSSGLARRSDHRFEKFTFSMRASQRLLRDDDNLLAAIHLFCAGPPRCPIVRCCPGRSWW